MKKSDLVVRRATVEDVRSYSELERNPSTRAWVGEINGRIIAMGGVALIKGRWFAFFDCNEEALKYKMQIMRTAIRMLREQRDYGVRFIYAEADTSYPKAEKWLASLGFVRDPISNYLFRWRA